jgi:hypothetical protein
MIGHALGQQPPGRLHVQGSALELEHRRLLGGEAQPAQPVEDRVDRLLGGALPVGILDPQQVPPAMVAGKEPVEEGRPGTPDVQVTGRRGCKPDDDTHG